MNNKIVKGVCSTVFVGSFLLVSGAFTEAAEKKAEKVRICHVDKVSGKGKVTNVSEKAKKSHLAHGDPEAFVAYDDGNCKKWATPPLGGGF